MEKEEEKGKRKRKARLINRGRGHVGCVLGEKGGVRYFRPESMQLCAVGMDSVSEEKNDGKFRSLLPCDLSAE